MSNIPIPLSKSSMADWISDFVNSLNKNKVEAEVEPEVEPEVTATTSDIDNSLEKSAEINIKDLPKVVWNDETFYVLFDNESGKATILNEFTNIVTTINAKSIEEVDELLNSKQVVAEKDEVFEDELNKNLDNDLLNKIAELEEQVQSLTDEVMQLREQQYARGEEISNLDIGVQEQEVQHFNETSQQTQESINNDNNVDITTPEGRTELSLKEKLLNELNEMEVEPEDLNNNPQYNEDDIEISDDIEIADDIEIEDNVEVSDDVEIEDNIENKDEEDTSKNDLTDSIDEKNETEKLEDNDKMPNEFKEIKVLKEQDFKKDTTVNDTKLDNFTDKEEIKTLGSRDSKIFKNAICPVCGDQLVKANKVGSFQGIICKGECKSEFAINLDTEEIFKK